MATSKGRIISMTINGETFKCDGRFETRAPRSNVSIEGSIECTLTASAEEMEKFEESMAALAWRMQWLMMWRVVGWLAYRDLCFWESLVNSRSDQ